MKAKITKRAVDAMRPTTKDQFMWDSELSGFGLKVTPKGRKIYCLQYRMGGPAKRYTIGPHGPWTPETARKEAQRILGKVASGVDPTQAKVKGKSSPTLEAVGQRYLTEYAEQHKKPSSVEEDRRNLKNHVYLHLGSRPINQITPEDIERLHHRMHKNPYAANRTLSVLSMVFKKAEEWGLRQKRSNPCRDIKKFKEQKRKRYLSSEEIPRLGRTITKAEQTKHYSPFVVAAIRLLVLTGARLNEVLTLKWEYLDRDRRCLTLPDSKTGQKEVYLNTAALEVLDSLPRISGNPYMLPGQKPGEALVNLQRAWSEIRTQANLPDVRLHDLRHSFAAVGAHANVSLPIIGALLGHTQASTTQRYAHLSADPLKQAAEVIGERLSTALSGTGQTGAPMLPFKTFLQKKQKRVLGRNFRWD